LLVLAAVFTINFLCQGTNLSNGVWYVEWLEYFEAGDVVTSWIGSISLGLACISGRCRYTLSDEHAFK
jgi:hypothetical protein